MDINLVRLPVFTLSPCHLFAFVTLSPFHLVTLSPLHLVTLSPCPSFSLGGTQWTLTLSDCQSSPFHLVTFSPFHLVTLSPFHLVTLSPCHLVTLSPHTNPLRTHLLPRTSHVHHKGTRRCVEDPCGKTCRVPPPLRPLPTTPVPHTCTEGVHKHQRAKQKTGTQILCPQHRQQLHKIEGSAAEA